MLCYKWVDLDFKMKRLNYPPKFKREIARILLRRFENQKQRCKNTYKYAIKNFLNIIKLFYSCRPSSSHATRVSLGLDSEPGQFESNWQMSVGCQLHLESSTSLRPGRRRLPGAEGDHDVMMTEAGPGVRSVRTPSR